MASSKRISKELADLTKDPIDGITVEPKEDNIYKWTAKLQGPAKSPYAGGTFLVDMDFPIEYPFKSPKVRFNTRIYHPNIDDGGSKCHHQDRAKQEAATIVQYSCPDLVSHFLPPHCGSLQTFASVSSRARRGSLAPRP